MSDILILGGARTPFAEWAGGQAGDGRPGGRFKAFDPFDLGVAALQGALERSGIDGNSLDRLIFGNMYGVGPHACYSGRYVVTRAGLPDSISTQAVAMACGTGLYAVIASAETIACGAADIVAVVGSDCTSQVRRDVFVPSFKDLSCGEHIAKTCHDMAVERGIDRAAQDAWALRSHERALKARRLLQAELVALGGVTEDEHVLSKPGPGFFAESKPLFEGGTVTHANTHGIVDGASALILSEAQAVTGAAPLGRYLSGAVAAVNPRRMAAASVPALRRAADLAGLDLSDLDLFEINETFAAQVLIDIKELGIPEQKVNVNGGALALGHPFGGTGCRLVHTLLLELKRRGLKRGAASISIGGGQGVAVIVETA